MRLPACLLTLGILLPALTACGQKGPLYLPETPESGHEAAGTASETTDPERKAGKASGQS